MTCTKCQHQVCKKFGHFGQFDTPEARYSPPRISGHISTSFVERQNLTMRAI